MTRIALARRPRPRRPGRLPRRRQGRAPRGRHRRPRRPGRQALHPPGDRPGPRHRPGPRPRGGGARLQGDRPDQAGPRARWATGSRPASRWWSWTTPWRPSRWRTPSAAVRLAEANLAGAERELKRGQELTDQQVARPTPASTGSRPATTLAAAQLDQARAGLRMAAAAARRHASSPPPSTAWSPAASRTPATRHRHAAHPHRRGHRRRPPRGPAGGARGRRALRAGRPDGRRRHHPGRPSSSRRRCGSRTPRSTPPAAPSRCWWTSIRSAGAAAAPRHLVNVDFGGFGDKDGLYVPTTAVRGDGQGGLGARRRRRQGRAAGPSSHPGQPRHGGGGAAASTPSPPSSSTPARLAAGDAVVPLAD